MALKDLVASLLGIRESVDDLDRRIQKARVSEADLVAMAPHTDDLRAWLKRGLDASAGEYERRLAAWYFSPEAQAAHPGTFYETDDTVSLLTVPSTSPASRALAPTIGMLHSPLPVSPFALSFFLRDVIEASLDRVISKHFADSSGGIRSADRAARLAKVRLEITKLETDRAELVEHLDRARKAVA